PDSGSPGTSRNSRTEFGNSIQRTISACSAALKSELIAVCKSASVPTRAIGVTIIRPNMTMLLFWACTPDLENSLIVEEGVPRLCEGTVIGLGDGSHCGRHPSQICSELTANKCLNNLRSPARFLSPQKLGFRMADYSLGTKATHR